MSNPSRRDFLRHSIAAASGLGALSVGGPLTTASLATAATREETTQHTRLFPANEPHRPVKVIDTQRMPWSDPQPGYGWKIKLLFENESTGDRLVMIEVPIGSPGGVNHYHDFHEWAYWLSGDFVNNEFTSPHQRSGIFQQFREGTFLDRPAYSLHGYEPGRLESQVGGSCIIMEEGGRTISVIPGTDGYSEEFRQVKKWTVPRLIETLHEMPWERYDDDIEGLFIKRLVENQLEGFRARLWRLTAQWDSSASPELLRPHYYNQAHQFNFVLSGDLRIRVHAESRGPYEDVSVGRYFYVERQPRSIFGLADGVVSEEGCVWLEVTYAKGTALSDVPVEEPVSI